MPHETPNKACKLLRAIIGKLTRSSNLGGASRQGAFERIENDLATLTTQEIFDNYRDATNDSLERIDASLCIIISRIEDPIVHPLVSDLLKIHELKNADAVIHAIANKKILTFAPDLNQFLHIKHTPASRRSAAFHAAGALVHPSNYNALLDAALSAETAWEIVLAGAALRRYPKHELVYNQLLAWFDKLQHTNAIHACNQMASGAINEVQLLAIESETLYKSHLAPTLARWGNKKALEYLIIESHDKGYSFRSPTFSKYSSGHGEWAALAIMDVFDWHHLRPLRHEKLVAAVHQLLREQGYMVASEST